MVGKAAAAASQSITAAAGVPRCETPAQRPSRGGANTLHVEYAVWTASYRIIHTRPDGKRLVWRRGIESLEEARLRTRIVADICGYEARL